MPKNLLIYFRSFNIISIIFLLVFSPFSKSLSQNRIREDYQYLSPLPGAVLVQPKASLIIRQGNNIDVSTLDEKFIEVKGSKSGIHQGKFILSDDGKTIIYKPYSPFSTDEKVSVKIYSGIKTTNGINLKPTKYSFFTIKENIDVRKYDSSPLSFPVSKYNSELNNFRDLKYIKRNSVLQDSDLPDFNLLTNVDPSPGDIFIAPFDFPYNSYGYLMILDNNAVPIYFKRFDYNLFDFKKQPNGLLSYFDPHSLKFYFMNDSYSIVDSISAVNGLGTDPHELRVLPNGYMLLLASDYAIVNMDTVVQNGNPHALVKGMAIQEFDENKNIILQWRTFDHFRITDATPDINLTDSLIDYVHANAIAVDTDGNLLLSSRHMDEITKINSRTGDIIWRWGGEYCKNNQFTFTNDPAGFSHQHDIRILPNEHLTLFDNGNLKVIPYSRACEYEMDEQNKTVTLDWEYTNDPQTYTFAMGNVERLVDQHTVIGWGANDGQPSVCELNTDGSLAWAIEFPDTIINYRAFKFNWRTNYFVTSSDSISFTNVEISQSDTSSIILTNNSDSTLLINEVYSSGSAFSLVQSPPFSVPAHENISLTVKFEPNVEGETDGVIYLRSNRYTEMIAQTLFVRGTTDSVFSSVNDQNVINNFQLYQNYPNPFNPTTTISYSVPFDSFVNLNVYDILGREVAKLVNSEKHQGKYNVVFNASRLPSGVYFYRIEVENKNSGSKINYSDVKKLLLIK